MPTPPTTPSNPVSPAAAASSKSSASGASKPRAAAKKSAEKPATEGTLIDKSLQKTTRKAAPKKTKDKSSFEKPAEAEWHRMISEAAYYRAERRGFQAGYEHEDWVWAEEEVRKILSP